MATKSFRVLHCFCRLAGENGKLRKDDFVELVKNSRTFSKTFDKNKDTIVTEVRPHNQYSEHIIILERDVHSL